MENAVSLGFTGLTTNVADEFVTNDATKYVRIKGDSAVATVPAAGNDISLIGITYQNTQEKIEGKVFWTEDLGDKYAAIACFSAMRGENNFLTVYTQVFYINK